MTNEKLAEENAALRWQVRQLENDLSESASILLWVDDVLNGKPVSEFAESFELVGRLMDVIDANYGMNCLLAKVYPDEFVCESCLLKNAKLPAN